MKKNLFRGICLAVLTLASPIAVWADTTITLAADTTLNLDTGATSTSNAGDIFWNGSSLAFVGQAKGGIIPGSNSSVYGQLTQALLQTFVSLATTTIFSGGSLPAGTVLVVVTNGGNDAKVLVTGTNGTALTLEYTTYVASTSPPVPVVIGVANNYSYTPSGFPNSGLAQGSVVAIFGVGMANTATAVLQSSLAPGIPTQLNGASVAVTVAGATVKLGLYYATATAIAGVLPSGTPTGAGTLTVTYNGMASTPFAITVVPSAFGFDTYFGTGTGLIVATNPSTGAAFNYANSAAPGQTVTLWGSGLGADPADSDTVFAAAPHAINVPLQVYIGGVQAPIVYAGSSGYPGVDIVNLTIPASVPTGCYVSVIGMIGSVVTNSTALPINTGGGICFDPPLGVSGTELAAISGQTTVKTGVLNLIQGTVPALNNGTLGNVATASFESNTGATFGSPNGLPSMGSCTVSQTTLVSGGTQTGLDAGAIAITGPSGSTSLTKSTTGSYSAMLAAGAIPSTGGTFTFTGSGGANVGPFAVNVTFPNPAVSWTNPTAAAAVNRTQGLQVSWTGGGAGSFVIINGSSSGLAGTQTVTGSYTCLAPVSADQFTVPPYVLLALPAGAGTTTVENTTGFTSFGANGLDSAVAIGGVFSQVNSTYN